MTAVLDSADRPTDEKGTGLPASRQAGTGLPLASWQARAGAFAIDVLAGAGVLATLVLLLITAIDGWLAWVYMGAIVLVGAALLTNRLLLPAVTGWTVGRAVVGIRVVSHGENAGLVRLILRDCAHLLDTAAVFVGWLWPLWDSRHRTFADLLARTEVQRVTPRPEAADVRRRAGLMLAVPAVVGVVAVGLGYFLMYRPDQALHQARAQITEEGPRIVEQLLSYRVDSIDQDFERATTLATDGYRPQLVAQQESVRKGHPTNNDYWAVSSALLPDSTKTEASMLLAMQGQRGTDAVDLQFITATVRVDFRKDNGQWQVHDLTVLKRPVLGGGSQ